jgi:hypothetical protein
VLLDRELAPGFLFGLLGFHIGLALLDQLDGRAAAALQLRCVRLASGLAGGWVP